MGLNSKDKAGKRAHKKRADKLFDQPSIRGALKHWHKLNKLGQHELTQLNIVQAERKEARYPDTPRGYGYALRAVLRKAIKSFKPTGEPPYPSNQRWGPYMILTEQYTHPRRRKDVEEIWGITSGTYPRWQKRGLDRVGDRLWEWEREYSPEEETPRIPFMAPPQPDYGLIGRTLVVDNLKERLFAADAKSVALFALKGLPGVGKSALAITLAHDAEVQEHFFDGVLWVGLGRQPDLLTLLSFWGMAVGIPANQLANYTTVEDRAQAIHTAIGTRQMLLVIDDAWQIEDALAFKLGGPNCAHLLTTRQPELAWDFAQEGARAVEELNEDQSLALLYQFVPKLVTTYQEEARELVKTVGGLPLALILIGRYLQKALHFKRQSTQSDLLNALQDVTTRLELKLPQSPLEKQPSLPFGVPLSLLASIEISDNALEEPARQMLRALSVFPPKPNSFSEEAALAVAEQPAKTLQLLTGAGLLEGSGPERYTMHQSIADYAHWKKKASERDLSDLSDQSQPDPHYQRGATYFAAFAQQHRASDGYPSLDADWQNATHFFQWAYQQQQWPPLVDGVQALTAYHLGVVGFMDARGHWQQASGLLERAVEGARALHHRQQEGTLLSKLGAFAFRQADFEAAKTYLQQSLTMLQPLPSSAEVTQQRTHCYEFLARLEMQNDLEAAHQWIEQALSELHAWQTPDATHQKGYFHVLLSTLHGRMGQFPAAIAAAEKGLALLPPTPTSAKIVALMVLGNVYSFQGKIEESINYQKKGIQIAEQLGDSRRQATLWLNLALDEGNRGHLALGVVHLQKALRLYQQMGSVDGQRNVHSNLGMFYIFLGEEERAEKQLTTAIHLAERYKLIKGEAFARTYLASLFIYQNKLSKATSALARAHDICLQLKLASLLPVVLYWQAEVARRSGQHDQALKLVEQSRRLAQEGGYLLEEGVACSIKGKILDGIAHFEAADAAHQASLQRLAKYPYELAQSQLACAEHYIMREGQLSEKTKSLLTEALNTFERLDAKRDIALTRKWLD